MLFRSALSGPSDVDELMLVEGMTLAIEPVVCNGSTELRRAHDGFGTLLADGGFGAHYEECIAVVSGGASRLCRR